MRSVGLLQREIEKAGIPTVSVSNAPELAEKMCLPRAVFVQYPFGRILGRVGDREGQRRIYDDMCGLLASAKGPNGYRHLPYEWPEPPGETNWRPAVPAPIVALRERGEAPKADYHDGDREL